MIMKNKDMERMYRIIKRDRYYPGIGVLLFGMLFLVFALFSFGREYKLSNDYLVIAATVILISLGIILLIRAYARK